MSDSELIGWYCASRSHDAFDLIVARHGAMVLRVGLRRLRDRHDAEDVSQITFVALAQRPEEARENLGGWLHRVARNAALNLKKSRHRRASHERERAGRMVALREPNFDELREEIDAALVRLSPVLREAVVLHYLEGRDHAESAQIAGCSESAFRMRSLRGLQRLKEVLARRGLACGMASLTVFLGAEAIAAAAPAPQAMLAMSQAWAVANGARRSAQPALLGKLKLIAAVALVGGGLTVGAVRHEANRNAATAPARKAPTGPIHRYAFDETAGPEAVDSIGSLPGTLVGGPRRVAGRVGRGALAFGGEAQSVSVPDAPGLRFARAQSYTLSAWVEVSSASLRNHCSSVAIKSSALGSGRYGIGLDPDNRWCAFSAAENLSGSAAAPGWHLVTAVQDGAAGTRTLYVDGDPAATGIADEADGPGPLTIGRSIDSDDPFVGVIDDVRVYDRALGAAEVRGLRDDAN